MRLDSVAGAIELQVDPDGDCPTFPKVTATQNGTALTQFQAGGLDRDYAARGSHVCNSPQWVMLEVPATEETTTFEFKDATSSIVAEFPRFKADRVLTVTEPPNAQAHLGDAVHLLWAPADTHDPAAALEVHFVFHDGNGAEQTMVVAYSSPASNPGSITFSGGELGFTFADPFSYSLLPTQPTDGVLQVVGSNIWAATTRCEGIAKCEVEIPAFPTVPFTFVP